jgi:Ran GTPase-activating protein (RanGAP) involved in mRNA processing and transport
VLKTNKTLAVLDLSENEIGAWTQEACEETGYEDKVHPTPEGPAALADGLKANTGVQQLNPFGNKISEDVLRTIMNSNKNISNFGGAVKLDYSGIGMDSTDAKVLAELLKANESVQQLHAKSNGLRAAGAQAIRDMLKANKTLTVLDLSDNEIGAQMKNRWTGDTEVDKVTPEGPAALADGLKANSTVQQLNCSSNGLDQTARDQLTKHKPPQLTLKM